MDTREDQGWSKEERERERMCPGRERKEKLKIMRQGVRHSANSWTVKGEVQIHVCTKLWWLIRGYVGWAKIKLHQTKSAFPTR